MSISAVVLTKNEEHRIRRCLDSLKGWVDQIIVVDDASSDATVSIASNEYGALVIVHPLQGAFDKQRNRGSAAASHDWIIHIDADESVPLETSQAILKAIAAPQGHEAFELIWRDCVWETPLKHVSSLYKLRLFRRGCGYFEGNIHENLQIKGPIGRIEVPVWNYAIPSVSMMLAKHNIYSDMEVKEFLTEHPQMTVDQLKRQIIFRTPKIFYKHYIKRGGFKDGTAGLVWCVIHTIYPLVLHLKALEYLANKKD